MTAKEYLEQIEELDSVVETTTQEIEYLDALSTKITSVIGDGGGRSSGSSDKVSVGGEIADRKEELRAEVKTLLRYRKRAMNLIKKNCDAECYKLLYLRYFQYESWWRIAGKMHFSEKWVSNGLHKRALSQLQKVIDKRNIKTWREERNT